MKTLQYCRTLSNSFGLIKGVFESGKTFVNVVFTLLLISIRQKVKVLSSFNRAADASIIKLHEQLEALREKGLDITNRKSQAYDSKTSSRPGALDWDRFASGYGI